MRISADDRLRIVSDAGQSLRHNVKHGRHDDRGRAAHLMSGTNVVPALGIVGAAYTNKDAAADTATSLFVLGVAANRVALQSPPNGVPGGVAPNIVPTGQPHDRRRRAGRVRRLHAPRARPPCRQPGLASFRAFGSPAFYRMNFPTGEAIFIGVLGDDVADIALPLAQ
jgi:hypothetical protein